MYYGALLYSIKSLVTLDFCEEISGSSFGQVIRSPVLVSKFLKETCGILLRLGLDRFLANPFQFVSYCALMPKILVLLTAM